MPLGTQLVTRGKKKSVIIFSFFDSIFSPLYKMSIIRTIAYYLGDFNNTDEFVLFYLY